ncbi:Apoptosis-inducing factor 1 [Neofusicoccum parvum]|uniref:Apoptosis-inducing factor 1 n=1 Tax=Neofusicoccum parvum TaxID=310453 RepID=A0ACB5S8R6_9PEZI|nr:Apoptosis-inducing factor 1 [Neofusicoccum parvum]
MSTHTVVVLGGSFAGLGIAHYLLRHVLPQLPDSASYKLVLVNPSDHFYFKPAAPRMAPREDLISLDTIMRPIAPAFDRYSQFQFVQAYARAVDPAQRQITLEPVGGEPSITLHYDSLIVATGASSKSALWSPAVPKDATVSELGEFRSKLKSAQRIIVAGGGAVGVETAGELGFDHGKTKDVILYSGSSSLLARVRPDVGQRAEQYLKQMGVTVVHGLKIISSGPGSDGKETLHLSDGSQTSADLFLDARGTSLNSSFLPPAWLNERGAVQVDGHLRVTAAGSGARVYAVGDIASYSSGGIMEIYDAVPALAAVIEYDLTAGKSGAQPTYTGQKAQTMLVPVGRKKTVGVLFNYWVPSYMGYMIKGKTFMADQGVATVNGAKWAKKKSF